MSDIMNDNELSEIHGKLLSAFMYQAKLANDGTQKHEEGNEFESAFGAEVKCAEVGSTTK